jgi:hypothetical protein
VGGALLGGSKIRSVARFVSRYHSRIVERRRLPVA